MPPAIAAAAIGSSIAAGGSVASAALSKPKPSPMDVQDPSVNALASYASAPAGNPALDALLTPTPVGGPQPMDPYLLKLFGGNSKGMQNPNYGGVL